MQTCPSWSWQPKNKTSSSWELLDWINYKHVLATKIDQRPVFLLWVLYEGVMTSRTIKALSRSGSDLKAYLRLHIKNALKKNMKFDLALLQKATFPKPVWNQSNFHIFSCQQESIFNRVVYRGIPMHITKQNINLKSIIFLVFMF